MSPPLPTTLVAGRYRILSHLGAGGMATVYRALHLELGVEVALKILPATLAGESTEARFHREARAAARLGHPGCVRVLDHGPCLARSQFIAMELLAGPTLGAIVRRGPLAPAAAAETLTAILDALAHAHAQGVLHRDVKPDNVMYGRRGDEARPILIDFGLAKLADASPLTAAGACYGSPSYVAPERLLGRAYDARADVYSAGVMLYELCAGARPYVGATVSDILRAALSAAPVPLRARAPAVSPGLESIAMRAIARDPAQRFSDAGAMRAALAALAPRRRWWRRAAA